MAERNERTATRSNYEYEDGHRLSEDEIVQLVRLELEHSMGYDSHVLGDHRARALDFYHGNTESSSIPAAQEGRSNIVSMDVHDTVNALMAELLPMMKTSLIEFPPNNERDEPQAQMESDFICDQLEKSGFDEIAYSSAHSALLQGLGWIKVEYEDDEVVTRQQLPYRVDDPVEYDAISAPDTPTQTVEVVLGEDFTEVIRTTPVRRLITDCVAPENILFSPARGQYETEELRFVAERKLFTVDELVEDYGLTPQEASEIPSHWDDYWPGHIARRERYYAESDAHQGGWQEQSKLKECFCCYMDIAMNTNGATEKWYLMVGGRHLIESYPVPFQPWVNGSPMPMPHRIQGRGMYEVMKDVQEAKTSLMRSAIDNAMVANGSRTAYNENTVNVSHLTNGRVNGVVAVNGRPGEHVMPMPATDITGQMVGMLNYLDEVRSSRGGASVDMNDSMAQAQQVTAEAAYNVKVSKEKMAGFYAKNLVSSLLKGVYLKAHQTLRNYFDQPMNAKIRGRWMQTNPAQWQPREYCRVTCGLTEVERRQKIHNLTYLTGQIQGITQSGGGGVLTDVSKMYNALTDWVRAANIGSPEEYFLDPMSEESQRAQQTKAQEAQQQMGQAQQLMQLNQAMEEMKIELDKYKHDTELKFKYWKEGVESAENTQDNQTRLDVARIGATTQRAVASANQGGGERSANGPGD